MNTCATCHENPAFTFQETRNYNQKHERTNQQTRLITIPAALVEAGPS